MSNRTDRGTYHVADLRGGTSEDEDDVRAVVRVAVLEVVASSRQLALVELDGRSSNKAEGGSEEGEELHCSVDRVGVVVVRC